MPFFKRRSRYPDVGAPIHAYDLETTPIADGTPEVTYYTSYDGVRPVVSERATGLAGLLDVLEREALLPEFDGHNFYAWNGNRYDAYFVSDALLLSDKYEQVPFLAKGTQLRGLLVTDGEHRWFFLDGLAATGLAVSLKEFTEQFSYMPKRELDLSDVVFDPDDPVHVEYAETDSVALYDGLQTVDGILREEFGVGLSTTIARSAIQVLKRHIPKGVTMTSPPPKLNDVLHTYLKRGGYVHLAEAYSGPVWKYDLNQAYAGAMREAELPCGRLLRVYGYQPGYVGVYEVTASHPEYQRFPFLYKDSQHVSHWSHGEEFSSWITSSEIEFLRRHGWRVTVGMGNIWGESFNFKELVDKLERRRIEVGPKTPEGMMIKAIGNNGYGKTLERLDYTQNVIAPEAPSGYLPVSMDGNMYTKPNSTPKRKDYHQPQIGVFITAHVRIQVMEVALAAGDDALYADTDCIVLKSPAPASMDIDPARYGAWKVEEEGEPYTFIAKKVYFSHDLTTVVAKGMPISYLREHPDLLERWRDGEPPVVERVFRTGFGTYTAGEDAMFTTRTRSGTRVVRLE